MPKTEPFDKYSLKYENWFEVNRFTYESELRAVKYYIPEGKKGIEIGVGSGRFAAPLGIEVGVDPSIEIGKIALSRGIRVIAGTAENLPLPNNSFDFALMVTTICFLDDIDKGFMEARRILKPGGSLIIGFVAKDSKIGKLYLLHRNESVFYKIATFYSVTDVLNSLKKADFNDISIIQTVFDNTSKIDSIQPLRTGYGDGSFLVISARSPR